MLKLARIPLLGVAVFGLSACNGTSGPDVGEGLVPFRDAWVTEVNAMPFPADASQISIGGTSVEDNFMNRGDVEVYFTNTDNTITVQMRRFTFARSQEEANESFSRMLMWAGTPSSPSPSLDPEDNCAMGAEWQSSCYLRAWYDGQIQAARDGADFRVYLPAAWEGDVSVTTEDNVQESETYPDRGDVIVKGARGNVEIEVENGTVTVEMADDMREVLNCDAAGIQACLDEGWPATCGCTDFSRIAVDSGPGLSANISVDIPGHIWSTARLKNAQAGLTPSSDPLCEALVDCDGFNDCDIFTADPNKPFEREVEFNDPGDLAVEGAGVSVNLTSNGCGIIPSVTGPEDFETGIAETKRGDVSICTGCLDIPVP